MFKSMKLGTKLTLGFGTMIFLAALLGVVSWFGLDSMTTKLTLADAGNNCVGELNQCAALRRDFAINGFKKVGDQTKNAAEKWHDAYANLESGLHSLESSPDLSAEGRKLTADIIKLCSGYKSVFDEQADFRRERDAAFANWGRVGGQVTESINGVIDDVIGPALASAKHSKNVEEIGRWATVSDRLDKDVVQPFLLLRVRAVYLLATNADAQWDGYVAQLDKATTGLGAWTSLVKGDAQLETVASQLAQYFSDYRAAGNQYHNGMLGERAASVEMASIAGNMVKTMDELHTQLKDEMATVTTRTNTLVVAMPIAAIIIGSLLSVVITRGITKPINRIITSLTEGATQVTEAAGQVSTASQQLAEGASEQASSLEETSSALEEMAAMTRTNAENAKQANELADQARTAAQAGDQTMTKLNDAMTGINESSDRISKIIKVIEEIAFQTNLLALNAAVEAARAGEHGKGFAVVAEEVRNLAHRSAQAAQETTGLIDESVQRARDGGGVAREVGEALTEIVSDVAKVSELIHGIAQASSEQAQGVDQVNTAVAQMDKVTQGNAAGAEESASAAEELSAQAVSVNSVVGELASLVGESSRQTKAEDAPRQKTEHEHVQHTHSTLRPGDHEMLSADTHNSSDFGDF